jgi:single-stranded DNA-binding protein
MGQEKGENSVMAYLNSITLVGFVGSDPQQRQAKGNGSKFTVLSIATQRSWKNADDEWSRRPSGTGSRSSARAWRNNVLENIRKGSQVLVEGSLVSSSDERPGKGKRAAAEKITSWSIRADAVRRLDRGEPAPEAIASRTAASEEVLETLGETPD